MIKSDEKSFYTRIPTLSDSELLDYINNYLKYKFKAIEVAVIELRKCGHNISNDELLSIQKSLYQKNDCRHLCVSSVQMDSILHRNAQNCK